MAVKQEEVSNVVPLPNKFTSDQLYNAQKSIEDAKEAKSEFCEEVLEFTMEQLFSCMKQFGFFVDPSPNRVNEKDVVLLEQAIGSILYRYQGLVHPFHEITEGLITIPGDEPESSEEDGE